LRCPNIEELPAAPGGRRGWPWTEANRRSARNPPAGSNWPRISIVTPSYNQRDFIEETIRSVLLQGYPDLEYIIIDGGSTDGSTDVIRKYERWLSFFVSEKDRGQGHAIVKGLEKATGEVLAWLNSDDTYCPETLEVVGEILSQRPDLDLLYGDCEMVDAKGGIIDLIEARHGRLPELLAKDFIPQPSVFFRASAWGRVGGLDTSLSFILDYDLWIRMMLKGVKFHYLPHPLSRFRWHDVSKSSQDVAEFGFEYLVILERLFRSTEDMELRKAFLRGYHQAFSIIASGYERAIVNGRGQESELMQFLKQWIEHLKKHQEAYGATPEVWAESLYRIGQSYSLQGYTKRGRKFFRMAIKKDRKAYRAFLGWIVAALGARPYSWYIKIWRTCYSSLRRVKLRLRSKIHRGALPKLVESEISSRA
jgi:glycosyltransferase involved in cell wall biosynthesis